MNLGKVVNHVTYIRCHTGAQCSADGHRRTSVGEIRQRHREYEERRAIFAQLWISDDYSDGQNVQSYIQDDHCTDDRNFDIVEIADIHFEHTVGLVQRSKST